MDTAPDASGENVKPILHENYEYLEMEAMMGYVCLLYTSVRHKLDTLLTEDILDMWQTIDAGNKAAQLCSCLLYTSSDYKEEHQSHHRYP